MLIVNQLVNKILASCVAIKPILQNKLLGKVIALNINDNTILLSNRTIYITFDAGHVNISWHQPSSTIDLTLTAALKTFILFALEKDPTFYQQDIVIQGDASLLTHLYAIKNNLNIDFKILLQELTSSEISFLLSPGLEYIYNLLTDKHENLKEEILHYLQYETAQFISHEELEYFYQELEEFRDRVERLAAKIDNYVYY